MAVAGHGGRRNHGRSKQDGRQEFERGHSISPLIVRSRCARLHHGDETGFRDLQGGAAHVISTARDQSHTRHCRRPTVRARGSRHLHGLTSLVSLASNLSSAPAMTKSL
jgi:hypothetical protein